MLRNRRYGFGTPKATGYENLIVPALSAVGFQNLPPPASGSNAIVHVTGAAVRWRGDAPPTQTEGIRLEVDSYWEMMETNLDWNAVFQTMQFISLGLGSLLEVQYFG